MRIEDLSHSASQTDVEAAVAWIAGMPAAAQSALIKQLSKKTGRKRERLEAMRREALALRRKTAYPLLRLATFIKASALPHRIDGSSVVIDDPLVEGDEVHIADNVLLGWEPTITKAKGYAHPTDDYVRAIVGKADIKPYLISEKDVKALADQMNDCDRLAYLPPRALTRPNMQAFDQVLKAQQYDRLRVALRLNQRFAVVDNNCQMVIFDNVKRMAYTREEFHAKLQPETDVIRAGKKRISVSRSKLWWAHPARAEFDGVIFAPCGRDANGREVSQDKAFNLWVEYPEQGAAGCWDLLKDHIKNIICSGNAEAYEYLLNWMAHLYQRPWEKPGVAVVVWGKKRTGKGTVADAIRETIGPAMSRLMTEKDAGCWALLCFPLAADVQSDRRSGVREGPA